MILTTRLKSVLPLPLHFRLKFATNVKHWSNEWRFIIYSDKKTFQSYSNGKIFVNRLRGCSEDPKYTWFANIGATFKINVWAAMIYGQPVQVCQCDPEHDTEDYIKVLHEFFFVDNPTFKADYVLLQDNAPMHVFIDSQSFFSITTFMF